MSCGNLQVHPGQEETEKGRGDASLTECGFFLLFFFVTSKSATSFLNK